MPHDVIGFWSLLVGGEAPAPRLLWEETWAFAGGASLCVDGEVWRPPLVAPRRGSGHGLESVNAELLAQFGLFQERIEAFDFTPRTRVGSRTSRYQRFLAKLRQARSDAGLTQLQVALALGRSQTFVSKSETGERRVDFVEAELFAEVYGQALTYFATRDEKG